jgi:hypothetical protein
MVCHVLSIEHIGGDCKGIINLIEGELDKANGIPMVAHQKKSYIFVGSPRRGKAGETGDFPLKEL